MNSFASLRLRRVALFAPVLLAVLILDPPRAKAEYGPLAFSVAPGGTINIQNLSGSAWYFYDPPNRGGATMYRVSEDLSQAWAWGSPQFQRDMSGSVSKVKPGEFLRVTAGGTLVGLTIQIPYFDSTFDFPYSLDIAVHPQGAQVLSINRLDPSPSSASSVRWEITFDRAVAGVRAPNLSLVYPASGEPAPSITNIVPASNEHTRWIVTANTTARASGTVALKWNASALESPAVTATFTGQSYEFKLPTPTTFTVARYGAINIRNTTDDGWYFAAPPGPGTVTMSRMKEDGTIEPWGSANFGPDITGSGRNRIARNQSLRIEPGNTAIGTMIVPSYEIAPGVLRSLSIQVNNELATLVSMKIMDPSPTAGPTVRWEVLFDRPVAGVVNWDFAFQNYAECAPTITAVEPDVASGFRKWTVTASFGLLGNGHLALRWQTWNSYTPESPRIGNALVGHSYEINPLVFSVPPNGTIDIENFYADRLYFRDGPAPGTAQMSRVGPDTIGIIPWGNAGFMPSSSNTNNWISRNDWLRIAAGSTSVGTDIVVRAYRTVYPDDTGFEIRIKVEVPDAQVLSADIIDPSPTIANSVRWDVTFNKAMSGVTAANFAFINVAQIQPPPTITSVAVVPNTDDKTWRVTADTSGTGTGLLGLRYLGHRSETPSAPNSFTGQSYDFSSYPLITADPTPLSAIIVTDGPAPTLTVAATIRTGEVLYYQWRKGTPQFHLQAQDVAGATSPSFTPPTNVAGHHSYYCRVFTRNHNGVPTGYYAHSLPATMHVYDPPEIVTQPANIALPPGGSGTITVGAIGTELEYQWFKGNSGDRTQPMTGANAANFVTPALTENTRFWVLIWNALGAEYAVESETVTARVIKEVQVTETDLKPVVDSSVTTMKARAFDSEGVATPGATITFETQSLGILGGATAGGNFGGRLAEGGNTRGTAVTDSDGWATTPPMWTNTKAGAYQVVAKSAGPTASAAGPTITIENQAGPLAFFTWLTQPSSSAAAGQAFATQPSVALIDLWSNPILVPVAITAAADEHAVGALHGTTTVNSLNGIATFTDLSHRVAEKIQIRISGGAASNTSAEITINPGPVAVITAVGGTPQGARPGETFVTPLSAKVTDLYGNGIKGTSVKFQSPREKAFAIFPAGDTALTNHEGLAKVTAKASNGSGLYRVTALPVGVTLDTGAIFQLWNFSQLESWRASNFEGEWRPLGRAADTAIPFFDDVPNLLKYAFNLNAQDADHTWMTPTGTKGLPLISTDPQGRLTVTFVRRRAGTSPGISYKVQFGDRLTNSSFAENKQAITSPPVVIDATWERVTVTDTVPKSSVARRFARVQVTDL